MRLGPILIAFAVASALAYWFVLRPVEAPDAAPVMSAVTEAPRAGAPVPVLVFDSEAMAQSPTLVLRGRTEANRKVTVAAETTGPIVSEPLRRGARVRAGDVLCRLDRGVRDAELAEAEARVAEAEAEAAAATELERKGFAANMTLKTRVAQLSAAQAVRDKVAWEIDRLEIRAPFDGRLETDTAELGTLLAIGSECATVIDLSRIKVTGFVAEREVDQIAIGQRAEARLINGETAEGVVSFVSRAADPETRTFAVEITLDNPGEAIRDGMTAEIRLDLPPMIAHRVPEKALTLDDRGALGVRVAEDGMARFRPVAVLSEGAEGLWVGGLPDRAAIIIAGQEFVRDGRAIEPRRAGPDDIR